MSLSSGAKLVGLMVVLVVIVELAPSAALILPGDYAEAQLQYCPPPPLDEVRRHQANNKRDLDSKDVLDDGSHFSKGAKSDTSKKRDAEAFPPGFFEEIIPQAVANPCGGPVDFYSSRYNISELILVGPFEYRAMEVDNNVSTVFRYLSEPFGSWSGTWKDTVGVRLEGSTTTLPKRISLQLPDAAIEDAFGDVLNADLISSEESLTQFEHLATTAVVVDEESNITITTRTFTTTKEILLVQSDTTSGGKTADILTSTNESPVRPISNTTSAKLTVQMVTTTTETGKSGLVGLFGVSFTTITRSSGGNSNNGGGGNGGGDNGGGNNGGGGGNEEIVQPDGTILAPSSPQAKTIKAMPIAVGASAGAVALVAGVIVALKAAKVGPFAERGLHAIKPVSV